MRDDTRAGLIVGWTVDALLEPEIISREDLHTAEGHLNPDAAPGDLLVSLEPQAIASHGCVVAQSGAGKSYFLGRLLEEILWVTKANISVIDPNADFIRFYEIIDRETWAPIQYDRKKHLGRLPSESSSEAFESFWGSTAMDFLVKTRRTLPDGTHQHVRRIDLTLPWGELSDDFFVCDSFDAQLKARLVAAHAFLENAIVIRTVVRNWQDLHDDTYSGEILSVEELEDLLSMSPDEIADSLLPTGAPEAAARAVRRRLEKAQATAPLMTESDWDVYVTQLKATLAQGLISLRIPAISLRMRHREEPARFTVTDIGSVDSREGRCVVARETLMDLVSRARRRWENAIRNPPSEDARVPTVIVIDEAHNVVPAVPMSEASRRLRDVVREIAAEGRKLGLSLLLCSQRPDKLDPVILSEIKNVGLMRITSPKVLECVIEKFGLQDESKRLLECVQRFRKGRVLLLGDWVQGRATIAYCAMRRTAEGGRNLRRRFWTHRE